MPLSLPRTLLFPVLVVLLLGFATRAPANQPPTPRYWTTDWSFQDVDVKQLFARLESIGLKIPVDGEGDVSVEFQVAVPLTALRDAKAYRFNGRLTSRRLRLENMRLEDFDASVTYVDGVLSLEDLKGRWMDTVAGSKESGALTGNASLELLPRGDFQASLRADSLPIGPLHNLLTTARSGQESVPSLRPISGSITGQLDVRVPIDKLSDMAAWKGDADIEIDHLRVSPAPPFSLHTGRVQLREGVVLAEDINVSSPKFLESGTRINLGAQVELVGRQRFQFRLRGNDVPLAALTEIMLAQKKLARGKIDVDVKGNGELASENWNLVGQIAAPKLRVLGLKLGLLEHDFEFDQEHFELRARDPAAAESKNRMLLKQVSAQYRLSKDRLDISNLSARVLDGTVQGTATLSRSQELAHRANLKWRDLQPSLTNVKFLPRGIKLSAVTSGAIDWSADAASVDSPAQHDAVARIEIAHIATRDSVVGDLRFDLRASEGTLQLVGDGKLFGGSFHSEATSSISADDSWPALLSRMPIGSVTADNMRLGLIARVLQPHSQRQWRGTADAQLELPSGGDLPAGHADAMPTLRLTAQDVALDGRPLSRQLGIRMSLRDDVISIDRISGGYVGGRLRADGSWSLSGGPRRLLFRLTGVRASDLLMPIAPNALSGVGGKVSGTVTVTGDDSLRFRGAVTARDSSLFSVPTGTIHTGIDGSVSGDLGRWNVTLPSIHGELAGGLVSGEAQLSSSSARPGAFDLSSRWNARQVDFGELLSAANISTKMAHGRITGSLSVGGRGIRSTNDLAGRYDAKLGSTQAAAIPGLVKADQFLGIVSLGRTNFKQGHVHGVIGGGAATIDEFWLASDRVKVWSEGKVQIASQRMELDVIISTGNFRLGNAELLAFASQLALQATLPVATLIEINQIVSNRTIHLRYSGLLSDPRVRLKPLAILREEAARFLLRELLVTASVVSGR